MISKPIPEINKDNDYAIIHFNSRMSVFFSGFMGNES